MNITGRYKDAIHVKDVLKIIGTEMCVQAKSQGLRANDGIYIQDALINIQSEGDGIRTTKTGKEYKGSIQIIKSNVSVISGKYAINSSANTDIFASELYINGVRGNFLTGNEIFVEEGNIKNE